MGFLSTVHCKSELSTVPVNCPLYLSSVHCTSLQAEFGDFTSASPAAAAPQAPASNADLFANTVRGEGGNWPWLESVLG